MIPLSIDSKKSIITWRDFGQYHTYEGRFSQATKAQFGITEKILGKAPNECQTPLSLLNQANFDGVDPSVFIFHVSRCGSTLLTRALAQSRNNLVYGEPVVINQLWHHFLGDKPATLTSPFNQQETTLFTNLLRALGRKRLDSHTHYAIKFSSLYCLIMDQISKLYPQTPILFIYRDPIEVLVSVSQKNYGFVDDHQSELSQAAINSNAPVNDSKDAYSAKLLEIKMQHAIRSTHPKLHYLNYSQLTKENLPKILETIGINFNTEDLQSMQNQFDFYSKSDYKTQHFENDSNIKRQQASEELQSLCEPTLNNLYQELLNSDKNINN